MANDIKKVIMSISKVIFIMMLLLSFANIASGQQTHKTQETINGELITKYYENGKLKLLTNGRFPFYYYEQYDASGKLEIKSKTEKGIDIIESYKNGILIHRAHHNNNVNGKNTDEYFTNEKLVKKEIAY